MKNLLLPLILFITISSFAQNNYNRDHFQSLVREQDYEGALQFVRSISPQPTGLEYLLDLGYAFYMTERYNDALKSYEAANAIDENNFQAMKYRAIIKQDQRKYEEALAIYNKALQKDTSSAFLMYHVGLMHYYLRDYDTAIVYTKNAFLKRPLATSYILLYANALRMKKQFVTADSVINAALARDSNNVVIIEKRIQLSDDQDKREEVIKWGEKLLRDSIDSPNSFVKLGLAYVNTKQEDKAIALGDFLMSKDITGESVDYFLAMAWRQKRQFDKSNQLLDNCIKANLNRNALHYIEAKATNYKFTKEYPKAAAIYDSAYYIFRDPVYLFKAGTVYDEFVKDRSKASAYYKKYLANDSAATIDNKKQVETYIRQYLDKE